MSACEVFRTTPRRFGSRLGVLGTLDRTESRARMAFLNAATGGTRDPHCDYCLGATRSGTFERTRQHFGGMVKDGGPPVRNVRLNERRQGSTTTTSPATNTTGPSKSRPTVTVPTWGTKVKWRAGKSDILTVCRR